MQDEYITGGGTVTATGFTISMLEWWQPVVGYERNYQVSTHGRVRSIITNFGRPRSRLLKPRTADSGYANVWLCLNSKVRRHFVHRLVMAAFIGPLPPEKQVNHRDGVKANNHVYNLEYVTPSENHLHALRTGLTVPQPRSPITGRFI